MTLFEHLIVLLNHHNPDLGGSPLQLLYIGTIMCGLIGGAIGIGIVISKYNAGDKNN